MAAWCWANRLICNAINWLAGMACWLWHKLANTLRQRKNWRVSWLMKSWLMSASLICQLSIKSWASMAVCAIARTSNNSRASCLAKQSLMACSHKWASAKALNCVRGNTSSGNKPRRLACSITPSNHMAKVVACAADHCALFCEAACCCSRNAMPRTKRSVAQIIRESEEKAMV